MKKDEDDIFLKSLVGVSPLKKSNKVSKKIPKHNKSQLNKIQTTKTKPITPTLPNTNKKKIQKLKIEKNNNNKKLKKGKIPIEAKIDFHGMSYSDAQDLFFSSINHCFTNNKRCVLFITGKGIRKQKDSYAKDDRLYYGKIRNSFHQWTTTKGVQEKILNIQEAPINLGGDGAFLVFLRKNKN